MDKYIIFQDDINVRNAWRDYFESLHKQSINHLNNGIYLLALLSEMANSLNYGNLKQTEIDRYYNPEYLSNLHEEEEVLRKECVRVLKNSKSFAETQLMPVE